jgi:DNA-directed RNA polymerase subunit M/transcription elongation factor TFIIS
LETQNCPKCKNLLNLSEVFEGRKEYHCWGCGLSGTYAEMVKSAIAIAKHKYENASKMTCGFCGQKKAIWYDLYPTLIVDGGPITVPACKDCRPEVARYLLQVPAGLFTDDLPFTPRRAPATVTA